MNPINNSINTMVSNYLSKEKAYSSICEVISIDSDARTCEVQPINGDADRTARLQASLNIADGLYIVPEIGSKVLLTWINKKTGIITQYTSISEINIIIGDSTLSIVDGVVTFNGGSLGGMCITPELKTQLDKTNSLLTALITVINGAPILEPGVGNPSALQIALSAALIGKSLGDYTNIENENILQ